MGSTTPLVLGSSSAISICASACWSDGFSSVNTSLSPSATSPSPNVHTDAGVGAPSVAAKPAGWFGSDPSNACNRSTTTRPARATIVAASCSMRGTDALMSRIRSWPPGMGSACRSLGCRKPSLVWNTTSTTASTANGLNTASNSRASLVVVPVGMYHRSDGADAHGLELEWNPSVPTTRCSTAMSGSFVSTTAAANGDTWRSARCTSARPFAPTDTSFVTGFSAATAATPLASLGSAAGYDVTNTGAAVGPGLAITMVESKAAPLVAAPPAQKNADDTASGGEVIGIRALAATVSSGGVWVVFASTTT